MHRYLTGKLKPLAKLNELADPVRFGVESSNESEGESDAIKEIMSEIDALRTRLVLDKSIASNIEQKRQLEEEIAILQKELDEAESLELQILFVELPSGRHLYADAVAKKRAMVLFDTTHGTNVYGMYVFTHLHLELSLPQRLTSPTSLY